MDWYYEGPNGQVGPVTEESIKELAKTGQIQNSTLVWHEGMKDWQSYGELMGLGGAAPGAAAQGVCTECGRSFSGDDLIEYGSSRVCAECKPIFVQKLKEGVRPAMGFAFAGFWIRLGAKIIDWMIISAVNFIVLAAFGLLIGYSGGFDPKSGSSAGFIVIQIVNMIVSIAFPVAYSTWLLGRYGATVGKMACKLKVVTAEGNRISYLRALGRTFAEWLSGMILLIGYIMAAFDSEKRALHDHICGTRVIRS
jgi:uncharacterized RDD family membrane protein YckC